MPTVSIRGTELQRRAISATADRDRVEADVRDSDVILLDDCSTDESRSIVREYENDPRVRLEFNRKNSGNAFKEWRRSGKYVSITESDDYADERLLELLVAFSRMIRRLYSPIAVGGGLLRTASQMDTRIATWRISNHRQDGLRISEPRARGMQKLLVPATRFSMPLPSFFGRPYDQLSGAD